MKASKVDHRRTAVSSEAKGILYEDPSKEPEDIGVRINERRKKVERLSNTLDRATKETHYTNSDGSIIKKIKNKGKSYDSIINSIANQNMAVQPYIGDESDDSQLIFALAENKGNIRGKEKKALHDFLKNYATLEAATREDLLRKLRRIVVLYFYGDIEANKVDKNCDIWAEHESRRNDSSEFVVVPKELKQKSNSSDPNSSENIRRKKILEDVKADIRRKNIARYRESLETIKNDEQGLFFDDYELNKCFVHYVENFVEKRLKNIRCSKLYMLKMGNLSEKVWKALLSYLTVNYIAIGKAVYNFAMSDISKDEGTMNLGRIESQWKKGISSFEYEKIKAEETLQRDIAVYVSFAVNNLSKATIKPEEGKEDILLLDNDNLKGALLTSSCGLSKEEALLRNIMMYFGGLSTWKQFLEGKFGDQYSEFDFYKDIIYILYAVRNESFHFTTANVVEDEWNTDFVSDIFDKECDAISRIQKDKFYTNNLHKYYSEAKLKKVLDFLYDDYTPRPSQVPAFNKVFVKNGFSDYLRDSYTIKNRPSGDEQSEWEAGLYYLFKEIYYNRFLRDITVEEFYTAVKGLKAADDNQEEAHKNFNKRLERLKAQGLSLSEICQILTVEKNLQNNNRKVKTSKIEKDYPDIFRHYTQILECGLRQAFTSYINKNEELSFLVNVVPNSDVRRSEFLKDWKGKKYDSLKSRLREEPKYQKWYILGKFLNPKQLNLLNGAVKHYIQFSNDVERRAKQTNNPLYDDSSKHRAECEIISEILDMDIQLIGKVLRDNYDDDNSTATANDVILDYFDSTDDYARYVAVFVDYEHESNKNNDVTASNIGCLQAFCDTEVSNGQKIGIYYDAKNAIPNRNIIISKLFGLPLSNDKFKVLRRINEDEINDYYDKKEALKGYRKTGKCNSKEEQEQLKNFQELKNRIELYNIVDYSEIVSELLGQLVNWVYIRERDLMYYQLGFHYLCLKSNSNMPAQYKTITTADHRTINGAILYQLAAINTNGLPVYTLDDGSLDGDAKKYANKSTAAKIGKCFLKYSEKIGYPRNNNIYDAGLELFQNMHEEMNINRFRNDIDHFKYYVDGERSILDLYSEMFDRFMAYDQKYRKNVPNILTNILKRHFIIASLEFKSGEKEVGGKQSSKKEMGLISIRDNGLMSDSFTYKLGAGSSVEIPARGEDYLDGIARLLYSPQVPPENILAKTEEAKLVSEIPKKNVTNKTNKNMYNQNKSESSSNTLGNYFMDIDLSSLPKG